MSSTSRWIIIAAVAVIVVGMFICKRFDATRTPVKTGAVCDTTLGCATPEEMAASNVSGSSETKTALPRMLEIGSVGCKPCQMMAPIIEDMRSEYAGKLSVEFYDVRVDRAPADQYGIKLIPTQIFLDAQGKEIFRHEGFFPKEEILPILEKMGVKK
jgi:thioredoxin 1